MCGANRGDTTSTSEHLRKRYNGTGEQFNEYGTKQAYRRTEGGKVELLASTAGADTAEPEAQAREQASRDASRLGTSARTSRIKDRNILADEEKKILLGG